MDRLFSRCMMNVFCMYLELASTACMRCGDTWIMCGSHNTRPTCGIRPKYILIHDQIHVSVRGVSSPNWGGIMTIPAHLLMRTDGPTSGAHCHTVCDHFTFRENPLHFRLAVLYLLSACILRFARNFRPAGYWTAVFTLSTAYCNEGTQPPTQISNRLGCQERGLSSRQLLGSANRSLRSAEPQLWCGHHAFY